MSFNIGTIASGSSGNSNVIVNSNTFIMSDCGISGKSALCGINELGLSSPDAILISHPHSDHIKSVHLIAKKYDIPIYATYETQEDCSFIPKEYFLTISPDTPFYIKDIKVTPFSSSHDTKSSLGFTFESEDDKVSLLTDTGITTDSMLEYMKGSSSVIIESNHDEEMLLSGPYPEFLKRRIKGAKGHLSNKDCASFCRRLAIDGTKNFLLAHLSEHNNREDLAFDTNYEALLSTSCPFKLKVAQKAIPSLF